MFLFIATSSYPKRNGGCITNEMPIITAKHRTDYISNRKFIDIRHKIWYLSNCRIDNQKFVIYAP